MIKKTIFLLTFVLMLLSSSVLAAEDAGMTPDSPFWGLDVAFDKLSLALISDDTKRSEKALEIAQERLSEIEEMMEENKLDQSERARIRHDEFLAKISTDFEGDDEETFKKQVDIEAKIQMHKEKVSALSAKIEIKGDLSADQQEKLDAFLASLGDDVDKVEVKIKSKKDETRIRLKQRMNDDDIDALIDDKSYERLALVAQGQAQREILKAELKIQEFDIDYQKRLAQAQGTRDQFDFNAQRDAVRDDYKEQIRNSRPIRDSDDDDDLDDDSDDVDDLDDEDSDDLDDDSDDVDDDEADDEEDDSDSDDDADDDSSRNAITGQVTHDGDDDSDDLDDDLDDNEDDSDSDDVEDDEADDEEEAECSTDADCGEGYYCDEDECEDIDDDEAEDEDESDDDSSDNILRQYGLVLPEYDERGVHIAQQFLDQAKEALETSQSKYDEEDFKASYAYAKFSKKLANSAMKGKYLHLSDEQKDELDRIEDERDAYEDMLDDLEDAECESDSDCETDEYCSDEFECEDLDEEEEESDDLECSVDADCDDDEFCDDGECEDVDDDDDSDDDSEDDEDSEDESDDDEDDSDDDEEDDD